MSSQSSTVHAPPRLLEHPTKILEPAALGLALSQNVQSGCPLAQVDSNENHNDPLTPGALSRWLLWGESRSLARNTAAFRRRFRLQ